MDYKKITAKVIIFLIITAGVFLLVKNDYPLYNASIGTITEVEDIFDETRTGFDGNHQYEEDYYDQKITCVIRNGHLKGQEVSLSNNYAESAVYDTKYREGYDIFVESIEKSEDGSSLTGKIGGIKRDHYVALVTVMLFGLFLIIGGKKGTLTILSLVLNLIAFYWILVLYNDGVNILVLSVPMVIFFTAMLLFFMHGFDKNTMLSFAATICTVAITTALGAAIISHSDIDYNFMEFLEQPFDPQDAEYIFISELLIGCLGAVMDVVVTVVMTIDQITKNTPDISPKYLVKACRGVGDDVIGTMVNIMFFTNMAASLPFFILSMRNGIAVITILRYHVFFEIARFLIGSIGVVLSIPVAGGLAIMYHKRKAKKCS